MKDAEMKFVNQSNFKVTEDREELIFNRYGVKLQPGSREKIYTKIIVNNGALSYYIKTHQNSPFDPLGSYARRENNIETKFQKVSKNTFDFYTMYLKTNNSIYMTRAQRSFIND